jgi:cell division septation protein DedD
MLTQRRKAWVAVLGGGVLLLAAVLTGFGCAQKQVPRVPPEIPTALPSEEEAQRVRETTRETIPLLPQGERGMGGEDLPPPPVDTTEAPTAPQPVTPAEAQTRYGYRVQLFATSREDLARQRAEEYQKLFDEKVYVEYEGLLYKVRVGDCLSHDEASALRRKAVGLGHTGAFTVDTQVNVR